MDQVMDAGTRANDKVDRIVSALRNGAVFVNSRGEISWMDKSARDRVNGALQALELPVQRSDRPAVECFMAAVDVTIDGERSSLCVIQEAGESKETESDLIAAIQAVMTDTSWFTRTIVEKLKALRRGAQSGDTLPSDDIDVLSAREREVLGLICEGVSDAEMSRALHLSPNTVRNHIASLYRKIGVNRRSAAIIWARERGITGLALVAPKRRGHVAGRNGDHQAK